MSRRVVTQKAIPGTTVNTLGDSRALRWFAYLQLICHARPATHILRAGARQLLAQAVEIDVETFLATVKDLKLADGRARVVRHGYGPT